MNTFPANAIPQFPPGHPGFGSAPMQGGMPMDPAQIAMMQQQQNYLAQQQQQQQQQLAAMGHQQLMMRQAPGKKSKKQSARAQAQAQVLPRHMASMAPPHGSEHFVKNAMAPPSADADPWADRLDELDARELAMNRYRQRNEMMAEVFGPEPIKEIPDVRTDPWLGLGLDGETLEAKVLALEASNAELEAKFDVELEAFRKRLETPAE